ncbi:hypothetical protein [Zhaonella formicivorans]|uniref:hypothetical protein n=1 Tax=Zhaonella formicivorans TaxID=2528593 RepID=UPI0010E64C9A|nr:hypothetical protein [Zhaonella formicivorans]
MQKITNIVQQLKMDVRKLGMPTLLFQSFAFTLEVKPTSIIESEFGICFMTEGQMAGFISKFHAALQEVNRPANLIVACKKCYEITDAETGDSKGYVFWPGN